MAQIFKKFSYRNFFYILALILIIFIFIKIVDFYTEILFKKIEQINSLKNQILQNQTILKNENQIKIIKASLEKATNLSLDNIIFNLQKVVFKDYKDVENLIKNEIDNNNWKILQATFSNLERKIFLKIEIPYNDFEKFYDFVYNNQLILFIENLKIQKSNDLLNIELNLNLR
jgi:hypothetical protein